MQDVKNIKKLLVAKNCGRTANVQALDPNNIATYLGNGEVVITDASGVVLTDLTALKSVGKINIKQRASEGDGVYDSTEISGKSITGYFIERYSTATEQVSTLTNPSISLATDTTYWLRILPKHNPSRLDNMVFSWKSGMASTPTQADVLVGLAMSLNTKGSYDKLMRVEAKATYTGTTTTKPAAKVIKGSKKVISIAHGLTLHGTLIVIEGAVYKVDYVKDANTFYLESSYAGLSKNTATVLNITDPTTGAFNLIITGLPFIFVEGEWGYAKAKFSTQLSPEFETSFITIHSFLGCGTYEQVREMEYYAKNFFGNNNKTYPNRVINYLYDSSKAETYDLITITWEHSEDLTITTNARAMGALVIAIPVGALQGDAASTGIVTVLNKYIASEYGIGTAVTLST